MRCLVTGATGFVGSHLARELLRRSHELVLLCRPSSVSTAVAEFGTMLRLQSGT